MGRGGDMGRRYGGFVRRLLRASGARPCSSVGSPGPSHRRARPRAYVLALLIALVSAIGASLATEAQAHKTSGQHAIVKITCSKVTFLMLGFPEGVTNTIHPKVKVNGKPINNFKS